jgi:hypothetical protein
MDPKYGFGLCQEADLLENFLYLYQIARDFFSFFSLFQRAQISSEKLTSLYRKLTVPRYIPLCKKLTFSSLFWYLQQSNRKEKPR